MNTALKTITITAMLAVAPTFAVANKVGETVLGVVVDVEKVVTNGYSANSLIGTTVHNDHKKEVGTVHDLILSTGGEVNLAIVEVGGFLGIGSKYVAVPAGLFKPTDKGDVILPGATEAELKKIPAFRYAQ